MTAEPLCARGKILDMENLFKEATVISAIKKDNPQSAAGPSGQRYSHLQAALCDKVVEDLATFATFVFSRRVLHQVFSILHPSANVSELGQKRRPVECGERLSLFRSLPPIRQETGKRLPALGQVRLNKVR